ncbi:MAG: glycosyltransferase family 4 protein [Opitutales bacterium]|nr:glycosyltransferase family 4 protein [Opitutales bacterium]
MPENFRKIIVSDQAPFGLTGDIANAFQNAGFETTLTAGVRPANMQSDIAWLKITAYDKSSTLRRIFTWLKGAFELFRIFKKHRDAELFIISNPPVAPLLPLLLKNRFSLLIWDIWPDALVHTRTLGKKHPIVKIWSWFNRKSFKHAQRVFTISPGLADALSCYVAREKISIVPLWADTRRLRPLEKSQNRFLKTHHLEGKFVVMYSGNIGNTHPVEKLVDIAVALKAFPQIAFVIAGEGAKRPVVEARIRECGADNVLLLPYQSPEDFPQSLAAADLCVITLEEAASQVSVPSKTYSSFAVGAPLLCLAGQDSELAHLVREHDVGKIFSPADTDAAAQWILALCNDPATRRQLSQNALAAAQKFTPANAEKFVEQVRATF